MKSSFTANVVQKLSKSIKIFKSCCKTSNAKFYEPRTVIVQFNKQ